jgi:hypothetical protein
VLGVVGSAITVTQLVGAFATAPYIATAGLVIGVALAYFLGKVAVKNFGCMCCNRESYAEATTMTSVMFGIVGPMLVHLSPPVALGYGINCSVTLLSLAATYVVYNARIDHL